MALIVPVLLVLMKTDRQGPLLSAGHGSGSGVMLSQERSQEGDTHTHTKPIYLSITSVVYISVL